MYIYLPTMALAGRQGAGTRAHTSNQAVRLGPCSFAKSNLLFLEASRVATGCTVCLSAWCRAVAAHVTVLPRVLTFEYYGTHRPLATSTPAHEPTRP